MANMVRDFVTDALLYGELHPDLEAAAKKAKGKAVLAAPKSVIVDEFGTRKTVWYPVDELPYPIPGEYRKVTVENVGG
jgi:hypothetical protein